MSDPTSDTVISRGTLHGLPCVYVAKASFPGTVGALAEHEWHSDKELGANEYAIVVSTEYRADDIFMAMSGDAA